MFRTLVQSLPIYSVLAVAISLVLSILTPPAFSAQSFGPDSMIGWDGKQFNAPDASERALPAFAGTNLARPLTAADLLADPRRLFAPLRPFAPSSIIGADERTQVTDTTVYPFRANVFLEITFPSSSGTCTGWMIGPRTIATAGHCVYDTDNNEWASSITVYPGRNGSSTPYGSANACYLWSVLGWVQNEDPRYDYGSIILDANDDLGNTVGWYGFRWSSNDASFDELKVRIYGYPGDKDYGTMWGMRKRIKEVSARQFFHNLDTFGGQSGSAVYHNYNGECCYGVGIHAYGIYGGSPYNRATRITKSVFNNLKNWKDNPSCSPTP